MNADYLVISCSLNPQSRSRQLAQALHDALAQRKAPVELIDLRDSPLPLCDGDSAYEVTRVSELTTKIRAASCVLFGVPIYNYDVSASAKNFVELVGGALEDKVVGFVCAAGGDRSYMSVMSFAASLMLDFRCLILPRYVYATGGSVGPSGIKDPEIRERIDTLASEAVRLTTAMAAQINGTPAGDTHG